MFLGRVGRVNWAGVQNHLVWMSRGLTANETPLSSRDVKNVLIFKALVFNSELDSHFTKWKFDSHKLSQVISPAHPVIAPPLVSGLLMVLFYLYSATDMSIALLITQ